MIICVDVMIPWPLSDRGRANDTVPSRLTSTRMRFAVGRAASRNASSRSYTSGDCGGDGTPAAAACGAVHNDWIPRSAATINVGAATR